MCDIDLSQLDFTVTETSPSVVCLQEDWGVPTPEHQGIRINSPEFPSGIPKTLTETVGVAIAAATAGGIGACP